MKELTIERGFQHLIYDSSDGYHFTIDNDCSLVIEYVNDAPLQVEIQATIKADVKATILYLNHTEHKVDTKETYHVKKDASLTVAYSELMLQPLSHHTSVLLEESGAKASVHSATVAKDRVSYDVKIQHLAPYTQGIMENYGIVMKGDFWYFVATGKFVKGAYQRKSHQTT
ncbi:MAG: SufD family Fe-S cluster assembly protein, partial [Erysipelotrichaceae bacterium]|nr:SufD family Fe-S cluster assembly protein [Erysipelotrichaceae bacterium]